MRNAIVNAIASGGALTIGLALSIGFRYLKKALRKANGARLLPLHVFAVSLAFSGLIAVASWTVIETPTDFWTYLSGASIILGLVSMILVSMHLRKIGPHPAVKEDQREVPADPTREDRDEWPKHAKVLVIVNFFSIILSASLILIAAVAIQSGNEEDRVFLRQQRRIINNIEEIARDARRASVKHRESALKQHCADALLEVVDDREVSKNERELIKRSCTH